LAYVRPSDNSPGADLSYISVSLTPTFIIPPVVVRCMEAPIRPTTCDRCGEPFNTSDQHPARYCSIACEEGRSPLPVSDPASDGYHLHLQGEPSALVGKEVLAVGLKRTCYAPDWHKNPDQYSPQRLVSHDEESQTIVVSDEVFLGSVVAYDRGEYVIEHEDMETGEISRRRVKDSVALAQVRNDRWWVA